MKTFRRLSIAQQTAQHLRDGIRLGRWKGRLPGVVRLSQELGVSTHTLRASLRLIEKEGLVELSQDKRSRHVAAKAPRDKDTFRIGLLLNEPLADENAKVQQLIQEVRHRLEKSDLHVFFSTETLKSLHHDRARVARYVLSEEANAWIVFGGSKPVIEWFAEQPFPALAIFGRSNEVPIASVAPDMATAARAATKHLLQLGHRRIVNLCRKPRRLPQPGQPEQAFLDELKAAGVAAGDFNLPDWTETPQGLHDLLSSLFRVTPPTALIINEVPLYMAVQQFLAQKQLRVPEDVSLIADNADPTFAWFLPSVAHISWSPEPIVRRTLRWATSAQRGRADRSQIRYPAEFIAGGTTAKAR